MKLYQALVVTVLTLALPLLSPAQGTNTDAALSKFKQDMVEIAAYTKKEEATLKGNPFNGVLMVRKVGAKLRAVDSSNLPDDLKTAFNEFVVAISLFGDLYQGWPEKVEEITAFIAKEKEKDPAFAENLKKNTEAVAKRLGPAQTRLDEVSKKYGVTTPASS